MFLLFVCVRVCLSSSNPFLLPKKPNNSARLELANADAGVAAATATAPAAHARLSNAALADAARVDEAAVRLAEARLIAARADAEAARAKFRDAVAGKFSKSDLGGDGDNGDDE